jgi:hypothetical protein
VAKLQKIFLSPSLEGRMTVSNFLQTFFPGVLVEIIYEYWETDKIIVADPNLVGVLNQLDPFTDGVERETIKSWALEYTTMFAYNGLWWNFKLDYYTVWVETCDLLKSPVWKTEDKFILNTFKIFTGIIPIVDLDPDGPELSSPYVDFKNNCVYFLLELGSRLDPTYLIFFNFLSSSWNYEFLGNSISEENLGLVHVSRNNKNPNQLRVVCFTSGGFLMLTKEQKQKQTEAEKFFVKIQLEHPPQPSFETCIGQAKIIHKQNKKQNRKRPWIWFLASFAFSRSTFLAKIPFPPRKRNMIRNTIFLTRKQIHFLEHQSHLYLALLNEQTLMVIQRHPQFSALEIEYKKEGWLHVKNCSRVWVNPRKENKKNLFLSFTDLHGVP